MTWLHYALFGLSFAVAFGMSCLVVPRVIRTAFQKRLFDLPSARKVHHGTVPRLGGFSFIPIILLSVGFSAGLGLRLGPSGFLGPRGVIPDFTLMVCGAILLYLVGLSDDLSGVRYRTKFLFQLAAACCFPVGGLWIGNLHGLFGLYDLSAPAGMVLTIFGTVGVINALNLIDGIDGLCSGLCILAFGVMGAAFLFDGDWMFAMLAFTSAGVLLPFLYYNVFSRKKIFMGDAGSLTLGYLLSFLALRLASDAPSFLPAGGGGLVLAAACLMLPVCDVVRVMFFRLRRGASPFEPDKSHIHHLLLRLGLGGRAALACLLLASACFVWLALSCLWYTHWSLTVIFFCLLASWAALQSLVSFLLWRKERKHVPAPVGN
ncbi:MAG: undecaprenyl/decaprenyl-phosphate alpha-N-acetylglucosaminyl 1-phosphate transferase [Tannerella sp.]|jgi:UDP-N-acetylmuramyl pentapeptide phosphotransferase/UDP-N-acetylglucosamine-1-phosphate transferase|nr:undecaprenyl/decaprenyl-phosphate alpha-N-acetylglucosaminyl 1-phosphate transferase [Tannerella sp.]